jgi:hypothetical protein
MFNKSSTEEDGKKSSGSKWDGKCGERGHHLGPFFKLDLDFLDQGKGKREKSVWLGLTRQSPPPHNAFLGL